MRRPFPSRQPPQEAPEVRVVPTRPQAEPVEPPGEVSDQSGFGALALYLTRLRLHAALVGHAIAAVVCGVGIFVLGGFLDIAFLVYLLVYYAGFLTWFGGSVIRARAFVRERLNIELADLRDARNKTPEAFDPPLDAEDPLIRFLQKTLGRPFFFFARRWGATSHFLGALRRLPHGSNQVRSLRFFGSIALVAPLAVLVLPFVQAGQHWAGGQTEKAWRAAYNEVHGLAERGAHHQVVQRCSELIEEGAMVGGSRAPFYLVRAHSRHATEDYTGAVEDYSALLSGEVFVRDEERPELHVRRAMAWYALNEDEDVLADCGVALETKGAKPKVLAAAYWLRGNVKEARRQVNDAIVDWEQAFAVIQEHGEAAEGLIDLAALYHRLAWYLATSSDDTLRDGERALKFARKLQKAPGSVPKHQRLATFAAALAESGHFNEAARQQEQAVTCSPPDEQPMARVVLDGYLRGNPLRSY